jgi:hypothetical protein
VIRYLSFLLLMVKLALSLSNGCCEGCTNPWYERFRVQKNWITSVIFNKYLQCILAARILTVDFVVCTLAVKKKKSGQVSICRIGPFPCKRCEKVTGNKDDAYIVCFPLIHVNVTLFSYCYHENMILLTPVAAQCSKLCASKGWRYNLIHSFNWKGGMEIKIHGDRGKEWSPLNFNRSFPPVEEQKWRNKIIIKKTGHRQYLKVETLQEKLVKLRILWHEHMLCLDNRVTLKPSKWECEMTTENIYVRQTMKHILKE